MINDKYLYILLILPLLVPFSRVFPDSHCVIIYKSVKFNITRNSYPVFYRVMLHELVATVKMFPPDRQTDTEEVTDVFFPIMKMLLKCGDFYDLDS